MKKVIRLTERDLTRLVKRVINEMDYEQHKKGGYRIIERVIITFNPGTDDVIKVEGLLGETDNQEMLWFKPTSEPLIYESSNSRELITDKEISFNQSDSGTKSAATLLINNVGNWMGISSEGVRFYEEINFGENINMAGMGVNFIGNRNCLFMNIKFDKI
jgi:hypothetical protein